MNKILLDISEVIETPRLKLIMPTAGWGHKVHQAIVDGYEDYISRLNWPNEVPTIEMVEEECRKNHAEFILRDCIKYLIVEKDSGDVVGRCAFPPIQANWRIPQFGISYFVRKSKRAKGYATEASNAMGLLAFKVLKAKKVEIYCEAENIASAKVPQKLGFIHEFTQSGGWPRPDGKLAELQVYAIFSPDSLPKLDISW